MSADEEEEDEGVMFRDDPGDEHPHLAVLRRCCITKTPSCLRAVYDSLQSGTLDPFYLDEDGLSGLDYLLMPDEEGHNPNHFILEPRSLYIDLLVIAIKLYYEKDPNDPILNRNLQKICTDKHLKEALKKPLWLATRMLPGVGIILDRYCQPPTPIPADNDDKPWFMEGTYAEGEGKVLSSLPTAEQMEYGISRPVSPWRSFLIEGEEGLYERQPMPEDLRAYREAEKRGGLRKKRTKKGGKKGSKKGSKKRTKKGKSKRTRRTTKKSRKSRN